MKPFANDSASPPDLGPQCAAYIATICPCCLEWRAHAAALAGALTAAQEGLITNGVEITALQARLAAVEGALGELVTAYIANRGTTGEFVVTVTHGKAIPPMWRNALALLAARPTPEPATCTECGLRYATVCRQCSEACCEDQP